MLRQETVKFNNQVVIDEEKIQTKKKEIPYFENMGAERKVKIRAEFANWEKKHEAKFEIDREAAEETRRKTEAKLAILSEVKINIPESPIIKLYKRLLQFLLLP